MLFVHFLFKFLKMMLNNKNAHNEKLLTRFLQSSYMCSVFCVPEIETNYHIKVLYISLELTFIVWIYYRPGAVFLTMSSFVS